MTRSTRYLLSTCIYFDSILVQNKLECKIDDTPSQIPMLCADVANNMTNGHRLMEGLAVAHPHHERK